MNKDMIETHTTTEPLTPGFWSTQANRTRYTGLVLPAGNYAVDSACNTYRSGTGRSQGGALGTGTQNPSILI